MIQWPNMLLVAGTGRNVGKTTFVCKVISTISKEQPIIAIKITPHVHDLCDSCVTLYQSDNLTITEETSKLLPKDSSKMLAAGATKVYFIQGAESHLTEVIDFLLPIIPADAAVVCESAALRNLVTPGLFVIISATTEKSALKNTDKIPLANLHIWDYNYNLENIEFDKGIWRIK